MKFLKITLLAAALFFGSTFSYASNFADTYGFSANGISLGNAMTARVNDWSSVYYNIGGLGRTAHLKKTSAAPAADRVVKPVAVVQEKIDPKKKKGVKEVKKEVPVVVEQPKPVQQSDQHVYANEIAVTYMRTFPALNININRTDAAGNPLSTKAADVGDYGFAIIGLAVDLNLIYKMPSFISSARFGLGAGLNDDMSVAKLNDIDLWTHDFLRYGRECQKITAFSGIGMGFFDDLIGIGGGVNIGAGGEGNVLLGDVNMASTPQTPNGQSKMDLTAAPSIVAGMYISPGQLIPFLKDLDFGFSYRQESYMEIYPFKTSAMAMNNAVVMQMVVAIIDYYSPDIYTFGMAYSLFGFTLSADMEYHKWSAYKVNASNNILYQDLPKFDDIFVYRLGLEYQLFDWMSIMCGGYYQPSFISSQAASGVFNFLDNDKYVASGGIKFALPRMLGFGGPIDITLGYQYQSLVKKTVVKSAPTSYNPDYNYGGTDQTVIFGLVLKL